MAASVNNMNPSREKLLGHKLDCRQIKIQADRPIEFADFVAIASLHYLNKVEHF